MVMMIENPYNQKPGSWCNHHMKQAHANRMYSLPPISMMFANSCRIGLGYLWWWQWVMNDDGDSNEDEDEDGDEDEGEDGDANIDSSSDDSDGLWIDDRG